MYVVDVGVGEDTARTGAAVSPRRIARRAIGKKAGFPIEFIRLTSVDSVAPAMAGTNGAHRAAACSRNQRIPLPSGKRRELPVTTLRAESSRPKGPIQFAFVPVHLKFQIHLLSSGLSCVSPAALVFKLFNQR